MLPFQIYPLKIPTIGSLFFRSRRFSLHLQLWTGLLATVLSWVFAHYSSLPSRPCASWPCYVPIFCTECGVDIAGLSFFSFFPFHLPISLFFFSAFLKLTKHDSAVLETTRRGQLEHHLIGESECSSLSFFINKMCLSLLSSQVCAVKQHG